MQHVNTYISEFVTTAALALFAIEAVTRLGLMAYTAIRRAWRDRE